MWGMTTEVPGQEVSFGFVLAQLQSSAARLLHPSTGRTSIPPPYSRMGLRRAIAKAASKPGASITRQSPNVIHWSYAARS
jgi:hypothetical protein